MVKSLLKNVESNLKLSLLLETTNLMQHQAQYNLSVCVFCFLTQYSPRVRIEWVSGGYLDDNTLKQVCQACQ